MDVEDYISGDEDLQEDDEEYAMPGQEGVSVWDLLGESFLKEASQLGASLQSILVSMSDGCPYRGHDSG
jgi:hypothetical protein